MISDASIKIIIDGVSAIIVGVCPFVLLMIFIITTNKAWPWQRRK